VYMRQGITKAEAFAAVRRWTTVDET